MRLRKREYLNEAKSKYSGFSQDELIAMLDDYDKQIYKLGSYLKDTRMGDAQLLKVFKKLITKLVRSTK